MKIIENEFGLYVDETEINGIQYSMYVKGNYFLYVKDEKVALKEYAPAAESGYKEIASEF